MTGRPFRIEGIRAGRQKPGLHAAASDRGARCDRGEWGACLRRRPGIARVELRAVGQVRGGDFHLAVGTAGSATLVLADGASGAARSRANRRGSRSRAERTTRSRRRSISWPGRFCRSFAAWARRSTSAWRRYGFYPAGGGRFTVAIEPCAALGRLSLLERGDTRVHARALVASLPETIAKRELSIVRERLGIERGLLPGRDRRGVGRAGQRADDRASTSESVTEVVTGFGVKGVSAEKVASDACDEARAYLAAGVPVGIHLADQLLVPMALAGGGTFRTLKPTAHTITNADVIRRFLDVPIDVEHEGDAVYRVSVGSQERLRPERGAKSPRESERGWGPASIEE